MTRKIIVGLLLLGLAVVGFLYFTNDSRKPAANNSDVTETEETDNDLAEEDKPNTIRIAAMGDMLPHDTVNLRAKTSSGYDYVQFMKRMQPAIAGSDIVFCNQEAPSAGEPFGISGYPTFNAPVEFSRDLEAFGCNLINLANNHVADKGTEGIDATLSTWENLDPLAIAGANRSTEEQDTIRYFTIKGVRFAFLAFTDLTNNRDIPPYAINMFDEGLVGDLASEASNKADFVIASAHWGIEDSTAIGLSQREWAQSLIDAGVDLIIGTGPHVLQPVEVIDDVPIFYSVGNFLSSQLTIEQLVGGIAFIDINLTTKDVTLSFQPTYMHYTWTAAQAASEDLLARDNLMVIPLNEAQAELESSLFDTTVAEQMSKVESLLNQKTNVRILGLD